MPQNGGKPCDKKLSRTQRCKDLPPCPSDYTHNAPTSHRSSGKWNGNLSGQKQISSNHQSNKPGAVGEWRAFSHGVTTTTSSTTIGSSVMDDEDDSKFSRLLHSATILPANFNSTMSILMDEIELLGSTNFHIRPDGQIYNSPENFDLQALPVHDSKNPYVQSS